jgi:hypothetical protein
VRYLQLNADNQQTLLGDGSPGLLLLTTVAIEKLLDDIAINGEGVVSAQLGQELIALLKTNGSLIASLNVPLYFQQIQEEIEGES